MKNTPITHPIPEEYSKDSYVACSEQKLLDDKEEPWLFYGEDEDFVDSG